MLKRNILIGAIMVVPFTSFGAVLFDQTTNYQVDSYFSDAESSNGSYFWQQAMADDFTISSDSNVTSINFWGSSENFDGSDNLDNFASFDIVIYDTAFNAVGSWNIATSALNATPSGEFGTSTGATGYKFTANISQALVAGSYRLHVGAVLNDGFDNAFVWGSADGNGNIFADFFDGTGFNEYAQDPGLAFQVSGEPVPEPASLTAVGLGIAALIRRRRKSA